MLFIRNLLVLFVFAAGAQAASAAEAWRIVASTGAVKAGAPGVMPVAVNTKQTLPSDSWVETAATGRIVLSRGVETIAVGPNSRVMLPALPVNGNTQVLQTVGTALYQIGKQKAPHFQVDTPYLAAVVKGTTFTVSVSEGVASVDVSEGLVEVATPDGAHSAYVQPGFTGYVQRGQRDTVVVAPTADGSAPGLSPKDGGKPKTDTTRTHNETSNTKDRVVITAAIGEVALDVKAVSGGLATGTDASTKSGGTKVASVVSNATDVVRDTKSDDSSSSSGTTLNASTDSTGASAGVDVGGGAATVDVTAGAGGASVGVDAGGVASVDVAAGAGGASVDVGVGGGNGNGNGNGNGLALGVGVGTDGGGAAVGVGVGNGGVGLGLGLGAGGGGGGLGLGLGRGGS
jgi:hypothetical protein